MYLSIKESRELAAEVVKWWEEINCKDAELIIAPSSLALSDVEHQLRTSSIKLGVQDLSLSNEYGAFTGQISAHQAAESGATHAIIGHSEMRQFFHVTDSMVRKQLNAALTAGLVPIVCVGETREERDEGRTDQIVNSQIETIFSGLENFPEDVYIAYEPRWAIGTGIPVDPAEAERVHDLIGHIMKEFHDKPEDIVHVLYGGSVNAENIKDFISQPSVEGALIGSASAKMKSLQEIIKVVQTNVC